MPHDVNINVNIKPVLILNEYWFNSVGKNLSIDL
jgi:hypothetical protein